MSTLPGREFICKFCGVHVYRPIPEPFLDEVCNNCRFDTKMPRREAIKSEDTEPC